MNDCVMNNYKFPTIKKFFLCILDVMNNSKLLPV